MEHFQFVFTGPECSGKTMTSEQLAMEAKKPMVHEYARVYLDMINRPYTIKDLDMIALGQLTLETEESLSESEYSICDTDLTVLYIWSSFKYGEVSNIIEQGLQNNIDHKHYFLCYPDLPWEADPQRENPDDRELLFDLYKILLEGMHVPFTVLKGDMEERLATCRKIITDRGYIL